MNQFAKPWLLLFLMSMPWLWVWIGLYVFGDYRLTIALYATMGCVIPVFLFGKRNMRFAPVRFPLQRLLIWILVGHTVIYSAWWVLSPFFLANVDMPAHLAKIGFDFDRHFLWVVLYLVGINPIVEEAFWRGTIYREMARVTPGPIAWDLSSVGFGFWHWPVLFYAFGPVWATVVCFFLVLSGLVLGHLYRRTGTLAAPILVHGLGGDLPIAILLWSIYGF